MKEFARNLAENSFENFKARGFTFNRDSDKPLSLLFKDKAILAEREVSSYKTNPKEDLRLQKHKVAIKTYQVGF